MSICDIARPEIRALQPYSSARMEAGAGQVMLNANESPWPTADAGSLNRYPDPQPAALVERLAQLYGVELPQILVGRGSDEAIDLLVRAFCRAGEDAIAICPPTFGMYAVSARIQGAAVIEVPLTDAFDLDSDALLAAITPVTRLVFLCSPNNPTGGSVPLTVIAGIAAALTDLALVVVDEAYIEFAEAPSALSLLSRLENVAVLRTLSKAHALAAARVGTLIAQPDVIALLRRIQTPYPLPAPCTEAALAALTPSALADTAQRVSIIVGERERLAPMLAALPNVRAVLPSAANFLCVRFAGAATVYRKLLEEGVVVRNVGAYPGLANCLRITIGTPQENARLLSALSLSEVAA
jgi:histidinol-phosphate aminotransferase